MPLSNVGSGISLRLQLAGKGGQVSWIIGEIIDHPMGMGIEPAKDGCPAGRAQRSGAEMIAEQRTLLCQPVDPWGLSGADAPYS